MRNYDAAMTEQLIAEVTQMYFLLEFQFTSATYRYTDRDVSVFYASNRYYPINFKFDNISLSGSMSVDNVTLSIDNVDRVFSGILLNEDCRNQPVIIRFGVRRKPPDVLGVEQPEEDIVEDMFTGILAGWDIEGDSKVNIEVVNEFILWNKKTLRKHSASCPWSFKGTECNYKGTGIAICDKTYDTCLSIGNNDQFGGFRFLPSIQEKETWWGSVKG